MVSSWKGWYETHSSPTSFKVCVSCSFSLPPSLLPSPSSDIDAPLLPGWIQGWEKGTFPVSPSLLVPLLPSWLHSQNWLMIADNIWSVNKRSLVFKNKDQVLEKRTWKQCVNDRKSVKGEHDMKLVKQTRQKRFWGTDNSACSWELAAGGGRNWWESRQGATQLPYWYPAFNRACTLSLSMHQLSKTPISCSMTHIYRGIWVIYSCLRTYPSKLVAICGFLSSGSSGQSSDLEYFSEMKKIWSAYIGI